MQMENKFKKGDMVRVTSNSQPHLERYTTFINHIGIISHHSASRDGLWRVQFPFIPDEEDFWNFELELIDESEYK